MKKRIKYLIIFILMMIMIFGLIDTFIRAKEKKDKELALEKDKIASKEVYSVKRENNKYTITSTKLKGKTLANIFYDDVNVYLYYDDEVSATLLKYNVESTKIIVLYENDTTIHGDMSKIGRYYKIGNIVFNENFKKIIDYPNLSENELLFPNLKKSLIKTDTGVAIKNLETDEMKEIITNSDNESYSPYNIKNDGKFFLLNKIKDDKNYIVVLNENYEVINTFNNNKENTIKKYDLLDDVPYLLETSTKEDKQSYQIYDTTNLESIYKSSKDLSNFLFDNTKFISNDDKGNIKLTDYVTKEEKILLQKNKKELLPSNFILASDKYSLILTLKNINNTFYIFYL